MPNRNYTFKSIGTFGCDFKNKYDLPHQATHDQTLKGCITLDMGPLTKQALEDLQGFDRAWLIFVFHQSQRSPGENFKAKIQPPRHATSKKSILATRSPHRFNPLGLTLARISKIEDSKLYVTEVDLIDGTPILDIKPYVPEYDSFPSSKIGWMDTEPLDEWKVVWQKSAFEDLALMGNSQKLFKERKGPDDHSPLLGHFSDLERFESLVERQLQYRPFDKHRHRIKWDEVKETGTISIAKWRVDFRFSRNEKMFWIARVSISSTRK